MSKTSAASCSCAGLLFSFNLIVGYFVSNIFFDMYFAKDIPWYFDLLIGVVGAEILIIADLIGWIMINLLDYTSPIF